MSLALNEPPKTGCSSFKFKQCLQPCTITSENKQIIDNVCKTTNGKPCKTNFPTKSLIEFKRIALLHDLFSQRLKPQHLLNG
jgi:hypothetical protein